MQAHLLVTPMFVVCLLGAECGRTEDVCVDLRGETVEVALEDPIECNERSLLACTAFAVPERFVVRVLDETVQLRELSCDIYRAELASGELDGLELLGSTDGTLAVGGDFALAELVRVTGTDCYGRLYVSFARLASLDGPHVDDVLAMSADGSPGWALEMEFEPTDAAACADVQPRCVNNRCAIFASRHDPVGADDASSLP